MKWVVFLLSMLMSLSANARIGETKDQCTARYGENKARKDSDVMIFEKAGITILIHFYDGHADAVFYRKVIDEEYDQCEKFSDNEIQNLLKANASAEEWKATNPFAIGKKCWKNTSDKLYAEYDTLDPLLFIGTDAHIAREAEKKRAAENENLEGF